MDYPIKKMFPHPRSSFRTSDLAVVPRFGFASFAKVCVLAIAAFLLFFSQAHAVSLGGVNLDGGSSGKLPEPAKLWLPFEKAGDATRPVVLVIKEAIKYVGLLAILALSWWGMQFLVSIGNDEKAKHARHTVIYALIGVILSVAAYAIIDIVNSLRI